MAETHHFESPLIELDAATAPDDAVAGLQLWEEAGLGHLNLRGDATDARFVDAVREQTGVAPPTEPNHWVAGSGGTLLWLGPDEWLLITDKDAETKMAEALNGAFAPMHAGATDVSSGQTVLVVRGTDARDLLAKGCSLDLHPRVFGPGRCAQGIVGSVGVCIRQVDDAPTYELVVRRSFADFLWRWLLDAGAEFGLGRPAAG